MGNNNNTLLKQNRASLSRATYIYLIISIAGFIISYDSEFKNNTRLILLSTFAIYPVWLFFLSPRTRISKYSKHVEVVNKELEIGNRKNKCFIRSDIPSLVNDSRPCLLNQEVGRFSRQTNPECIKCHLKFMFGRSHPVLKLSFYVLNSPNRHIRVKSPYLFQKFFLNEWVQLSKGLMDYGFIDLEDKFQSQNDLFSDSDIPTGEKLIWLDTAYVQGHYTRINHSFTSATSTAGFSGRPALLEGRQFRAAPMATSVKKRLNARLAGILILTNKSLIFKRGKTYIPFDLKQFSEIKFTKNKIIIGLGASLGGYEYEIKDVDRWQRYYNLVKKSI